MMDVPIEIDDNGRVVPESIDALSRPQLKKWLRRRLHDEDGAVPDRPRRDVRQYVLIDQVYSQLERETQRRVREILLDFLREVGSGEWDERAAHDLFLLLMDLPEEHGPRRLREESSSDGPVTEPRFSPPLLRMAKDGVFLEGNQRDLDLHARLHARLLQALIFHGEKAEPEFWMAQVERDASRFGIQAFIGLRMHSLYQAYPVLKDLDLDDSGTRIRLISELDALLATKRYDEEEIVTQTRDMWDQLSPEQQEIVLEGLSDVKGDLPSTGEEKPGNAARRVLGQHGYLPKPEEISDLSADEEARPAVAA